MASSIETSYSGGYDNSFLDTVPERFICFICTKPMKDPHLMACCGKKFCQGCLKMWFHKHQQEICPHCRSTKEQYPVLHILDKGTKGEIESLTIKCANCSRGCEWEGELIDLEPHLEKCDHERIPCPLGCTMLYNSSAIIRDCARIDMPMHLLHFCTVKDYQCKSCDFVGPIFDYYDHKKTCQKTISQRRLNCDKSIKIHQKDINSQECQVQDHQTGRNIESVQNPELPR